MCTAVPQALWNDSVGGIAICWDGKCEEDRQPAPAMAKVESSFCQSGICLYLPGRRSDLEAKVM